MKLVEAFRPNDDRGYHRLCQEPRERNSCRRQIFHNIAGQVFAAYRALTVIAEPSRQGEQTCTIEQIIGTCEYSTTDVVGVTCSFDGIVDGERDAGNQK